MCIGRRRITLAVCARFANSILYKILRIVVQNSGKPMARKAKQVEAVAYIRTSSAANVGADKDSESRQRDAVTKLATTSLISEGLIARGNMLAPRWRRNEC